MNESETIQNDPILLPVLQAENEAEFERLITKLISSHAEPIIREIIKYKLRTYGGRSSADAIDAEDVYGETLVQILEELRSVRSNHERSICNFRSYVATVTYHCCYEYLREKRPQRSRLKDRIRYLLSHHKSFALWSGEKDDWICGFALWKD